MWSSFWTALAVFSGLMYFDLRLELTGRRLQPSSDWLLATAAFCAICAGLAVL